MRSPATSATSATPTTTKAMKFAIATIFLLLAILFGLFFRAYFSPQASISPSHLSLRQHQGHIQWKPTNAEDTDDNWHTITTISALTGKDGKDGKDGQDGTDGQNGANGTNGSDGVNGQNGTHGQSGPQGEQGEQGIQGPQGNQGQSGANGNDGQDGADGLNGTDGRDGADGRDGIDGQDGQDGTNGTSGREIELQKDLYFIQWRYVGEPGWRNLIAYSELKGDKGDTGEQGVQGIQGPIGLTGPQGPSLWGGISGSLSSQTDLQQALDGKVSLTSNQTIAGTKTFSSALITPSGTSIGGVLYLTGTGFPNGVVSAPVGSKYIDTAITNGAQEWIKKTGTGNTGWVVSVGDTGERRYSTPYLLNGYTQYLTYPHISPHVTRVGDIVYWSGSLASIQEGLVNGGEILDAPLGFRPAVGVVNGIVRGMGGGATAITSITVNSGKLRFTHPGSVPTNLTYGMIQFSYVTNDPWPVELPGEAG